MRVGLVIPTLNPGKRWLEVLAGLEAQTRQPDHVLVIDSSSDDGAVEVARAHGHEAIVIPRAEFDHGATRQMAVDHLPDADIIIFQTQDAIPANSEAYALLLDAFADEAVGCANGRQLPHAGAAPINVHARLFNYPDTSAVRSIEDAPRLGIKTAFLSNSFAAYRRSALMAIGGFPANVILSEDVFVAAKMLLAGWKVAYRADARVYHSHDYSLRQEFRRNFDIGVFHARERWIQERLGTAETEGVRFVLSEMRYLTVTAPWLIPSALLRSMFKYLGYRMGRMERLLPAGLKKLLSMNRRYWD